jgi:hypothetical protein
MTSNERLPGKLPWQYDQLSMIEVCVFHQVVFPRGRIEVRSWNPICVAVVVTVEYDGLLFLFVILGEK